ncbi:MAG TPA: pilus assembly protein TadG-related protein, partial [Sphingomicrobium sp.]|nr:pilus assembly protein TadG-related protein [Sphingomicrobium sp.]
MFGFLKKLWRDRRGNALIIAGAALPLIVGSAGLASDTIEWALWKRQLQRAADSAAEAGAYAKVAGATLDNCSAVATATYDKPIAYDVRQNNHLPQTPTCSATNPPSTGGYTSDSNAVRVTVSMQRALSFSGMFMTAAPTITANATATIVPSGKYCVISLESGSTTGIDATGSTNVNLGCGMITNSTSMSAALATGSATVFATPIAAVGGIPSSTHWNGATLQPFTISQADPFGNVPLPTPSSCTGFPSNSPHSTVNISNPTGTKCFNTSGDIKGDIYLDPGTYIFDQGAGLTMTNTGGSINCTGCTIIFMNSSGGSVGTVDLHGGLLNMTAPSTGCTLGNTGCYDGILFYQSRTAASDNSVLINGNNGSTIQGALYFPKADLTFNGDSGMHANCMQIVGKDVIFKGNSSVSNTC